MEPSLAYGRKANALATLNQPVGICWYIGSSKKIAMICLSRCLSLSPSCLLTLSEHSEHSDSSLLEYLSLQVCWRWTIGGSLYDGKKFVGKAHPGYRSLGVLALCALMNVLHCRQDFLPRFSIIIRCSPWTHSFDVALRIAERCFIYVLHWIGESCLSCV